MFSTLGLILATVSVSSAHFILHWPPTAGFIDDTESTGPCGGATVSVNSSSPQVQVEQFAVQIESTHPEGQWMFRGTLSTEEPYNWTDIVPVVNTTGLGEFCLPSLRVPSEWAGSAGILQVIDNSPDGTLYQCAPVNFVTGANSTLGGACTNATGFTAEWTTTSTESNSSSEGSSSGSVTMSMASSTASAAATGASVTSTAAAAAATGIGSVFGLGLLAAGLFL